jgi:trehalose 6-phosphate synthase/phosphatase
MFRALVLFPPGSSKVTMDPPLSVTLIEKDSSKPAPGPVELVIKPEAVFTTAVGPGTKLTLASWHVTTPAEVVSHMLELVRGTPISGPGSDEPRSSL